LPPSGESDSIRQAYVPALLDGERIEGVVLDGYFHEHSTPARYLEGNLNCLYGRARLHYPPAPFTGIDSRAVVDASAKIVEPVRIGAGARIGVGAVVGPGVVVGRDAEIAAGAQIERAVVWPGATVKEKVADSIVTKDAIVSANDA
jgi:mannose-1-phosphate guanylyltransferase